MAGESRSAVRDPSCSLLPYETPLSNISHLNCAAESTRLLIHRSCLHGDVKQLITKLGEQRANKSATSVNERQLLEE
eukprot:720-Heterococcus_DN1.PRE.3